MNKSLIICMGFVFTVLTGCTSADKAANNAVLPSLATETVVEAADKEKDISTPSAQSRIDMVVTDYKQVHASAADNNKLNVTFSTDIIGNTKARNHNINKAAQTINGRIIQPNEVFSFNEATGETNKENGYKKARIFIKGREEEGYGGGVCQVSTTLYNAALASNLNIIERHKHSRKVSYVPEGMDAAVSFGGIDLKFENNKQYPIMLDVKVENKKIIVNITGV